MIKPETNRTNKYKKSQIQENILHEMNKTLLQKELELINKFNKPKLPVIFIIGAQRSGTTILIQLITQMFDVSYPNNFIARYWDVPYIGAMLFKNLSSNLDENKLDFNSDLGYTKGLKGPHEFGYFWEKWFPWKSWEEKNYSEINYSILQKQLAAWESVNNNPLVFKNLIQINFNINKLKEIIPNSYFIFVKRELAFNIQSTYQSRINLSGNENNWFGVKPKNFNKYNNLSNIEQITNQIIDTNNDINEQLKKVDDKYIYHVNYEDLIHDFKTELINIKNKLYLTQKSKFDDIELTNGNKIKIDKKIFNEIQNTITKVK